MKSEPIRPDFVPLLNGNAARSKQVADLAGVPAERLFQNGNENGKRVLT